MDGERVREIEVCVSEREEGERKRGGGRRRCFAYEKKDVTTTLMKELNTGAHMGT